MSFLWYLARGYVAMLDRGGLYNSRHTCLESRVIKVETVSVTAIYLKVGIQDLPGFSTFFKIDQQGYHTLSPFRRSAVGWLGDGFYPCFLLHFTANLPINIPSESSVHYQFIRYHTANHPYRLSHCQFTCFSGSQTIRRHNATYNACRREGATPRSCF